MIARAHQMNQVVSIPFFSERYMDTISSLLIDEFISAKKKEMSEATVNRCLALLSKMFNDAVRWQYLKESPMKRVSKLDEPEQGFSYLTKAEVEKLIEGATAYSKPILMTAVYTGMRKSELLALKWNHVDLEQGIISVEETVQGTTKSKKVRYVPIHPVLLLELKRIKARSKSEQVFPGPKGEMQKDFRKALELALKRSGLKKIRVHDLRHTFAANFMMAGGNILTLQKLLGHSTINMTLRYAHLAPEFMHQEMNRMNFSKQESDESTMQRSGSKLRSGSEEFGKMALGSEKSGHKLGTKENETEKEDANSLKLWCPGTELNRRHADFQSAALPTELPGLEEIAGRTEKMVAKEGRKVKAERGEGVEVCRLEKRSRGRSGARVRAPSPLMTWVA